MASTTTTRSAKVWITGDQTIDWAVQPYDPHDKHLSLSADERLHVQMRLYWHPGGVFQLKPLIQAALGEGSKEPSCVPEPEERDLSAYGLKYSDSFAVLADYQDKHKPTATRVKRFIGFRPRPSAAPIQNFTDFDGLREAHTVVIDDANQGLRSNEGYRRKLIRALRDRQGSPPWILLKLSYDVTEAKGGDFWHEMLEVGRELDGRLIIVTSAVRLRDAGAEISKDLSWNQSIGDLLFEIDKNPQFSTLKRCPHLVVSFGPSGAILLNRSSESEVEWTLVYDGKRMEKEWLNSHDEGMMFGYGSVLCAALVAELTRGAKRTKGNDDPDFARGMKQGLAAMQQLYEQGILLNKSKEGKFSLPKEIFSEPENDLHVHHGTTPSHIDDRNACRWILKDRDIGKFFDIARKGKKELESDQEDLPVAQFGKLIIADQPEIEGLRAVSGLIGKYTGASLGDKPLAIAVFGGPGSGKGYTIKQVADRWLEGGPLSALEFKLSEFRSASELVGALHQIRDDALKGKIPLVVWDEFDSDFNGRLGWLRYFLGPIQDGKFQQADITHMIGPAIFVFAGGTSESFAQFRLMAKRHPETKGPDFLSRLHGYIDIPGINSIDPHSSPRPRLMLRRALILNSLFDKAHVGKDSEKGFSVDDHVLRAFLKVPQYSHGVRSMEAIIMMSMIQKDGQFDRSSLPSRDQLKLHLPNADKFLSLMRDS